MRSKTQSTAAIKLRALITLMACTLVRCAGNTNPLSGANPTTSVSAQESVIAGLTGARVSFFHDDFYSLTNPNPNTHCAGDAKNYYDPLLMSGSVPLLLETSATDTTTTIRPAFIKNIAVDQTDTNANISLNNAFSCSYGNGSNAPPVSSCATFDFGAINGIPSSLGGTMIIEGGLSTQNYNTYSPTCGPIVAGTTPSSTSGFNTCPTGMYALGINVLSSSSAGTSLAPSVATGYTGSISSWTNLATGSATAPGGIAGGAAAYSPDLNSVIIFSGSSPLSGVNSLGSAVSTYNTWIYNLSDEAWAYQIANSVVDPNLLRLFDYNATYTLQLSKPSGGRSLFGYAAVPGMAIAQLSQNGQVLNDAGIDITDRIITTGGVGACSGGACTDTHRFNPTFAPEYFDTLTPTITRVATPISAPAPAVASATYPLQWIDNYPTQLMTNSNAASNYFPNLPSASPSPVSIGFGFVGLNNNGTLGAGVPATTISGSNLNPQTSNMSAKVAGTGYLVAAGGFLGTSATTGNINRSASCTNQLMCGGLTSFLRWSNSGTNFIVDDEKGSAVFNATTNFLDTLGHQNFPGKWFQYTPTPTADVPWFGGVSMVNGLRLNSTNGNNEALYFGGSDCKYYLVGPRSTGCTDGTNTALWPGSALGLSLGNYWSFGATPAPNPSPSPISIDSSRCLSGSTNLCTYNAGMAAARGTDPSGNPLIVAWGGMKDVATPDATGNIFYMYNNSGVPTWNYTLPSSGAAPPGVGNASLVFSHVTRKFYLFGGYSPLQGSVGTTWELSVSSTTPSCGLNGGCVFSWRLLSATTGLSCYPSCPPGRRSHRMVEANYAYLNAPNEPVCTAAQPCSFGLFMEGGTADGISNFGDRWMFDPTANGGAGNWQAVGDFSPRTLASLAVADYSSITTGTVQHRAVMFGGETGMQDSLQAYGGNSSFFVPPTLGDTWIYDFDSSSWNRAILYGKKYPRAMISALPETAARAADPLDLGSSPQSDAPHVYSPPPSAGGIMVVRGSSKVSHSASDSAVKLVIPEIFYFGGRKKDGTFNLLSDIYKFCSGSTGEKPYPTSPTGALTCLGPNNATCDYYDVETNIASQSPSNAFVGKWIEKSVSTLANSSLLPSNLGTYLGAGAYDSVHDYIAMYGGWSPTASATSATAAITDTSSTTLDYCGDSGATNSCILEYTPPSAVTPSATGAVSGCPNTISSVTADQVNGSWTLVPACQTSANNLPVGRYGHNMSYDSFHQLLVIVGGNDSTGTPLKMPGTNSPDIWTATRIDGSLPGGNPALNIPPILSNTFPCYYWAQITAIANTSLGPQTGLANAASIFIPSSGYNSGYYTTTDNACIGAGPIASSDSTINKTLVGGAYFDIDRTALKTNENLILNVTILPLGTYNEHPDQTRLAESEVANFRVHLIATGQTTNTIRQQPQPRNLVYSSTTQFPQIVQELTLLSNPSGAVHQEQLLIPLSANPLIDRIRIERYSGNAILIDAALYRMNHN